MHPPPIQKKKSEDIKNKAEELVEYVIEKGYKYLDIDGVKVLFDDGFAVNRFFGGEGSTLG